MARRIRRASMAVEDANSHRAETLSRHEEVLTEGCICC